MSTSRIPEPGDWEEAPETAASLRKRLQYHRDIPSLPPHLAAIVEAELERMRRRLAELEREENSKGLARARHEMGRERRLAV